MANNMRWRYGDTNPVMHPVASATAIEIGDLVYLDGSTVKPASDLADQGSPLANQAMFQTLFVGVAMQASPAGRAGSVRIATTGVFEFPCDSDPRPLGQPLAVEASGTALDAQKVEQAVGASSAVGRCAQHVNPASGRVLVDIVSQVMRGGVVE